MLFGGVVFFDSYFYYVVSLPLFEFQFGMKEREKEKEKEKETVQCCCCVCRLLLAFFIASFIHRHERETKGCVRIRENCFSYNRFGLSLKYANKYSDFFTQTESLI